MSEVQRLTREQVDAMRGVPLGAMPNKLRIAMALMKMRQVDIVNGTGLLAPVVSDIVNGKYGSLMVPTAYRFAEFFGCAIEDLFPARDDERQAVGQ